MTNFITVKNETKTYGSGDHAVTANQNISFDIAPGELTIILGASGAGKSTLLNVLGGMDHLTSGSVNVNGIELGDLDSRGLTTYRRKQIGFVFQFYNLVQNLTTRENVELAAEIADQAMPADEALKAVGLEKRTENFPAQLSGGEQQRVAIARAMAKNPALLLADEPTGALDYKTGKKILQLFQDFARQSGKNVIIVTHNSMIRPMADHVIEIADGQVKADTRNAQPTPVAELEW
ncbi:MAG: ABC transporter ATP-binding protein [Lactobacillus sp.]|jgi:putative ABC transport system ATP-binding protein|uniref:ABC transporter ATP-binding protein n=1 Tax=Lacticaseibacillus suilingensis TaxID=2799577 RepID=A0ABW4BBY8_9LACO|nr:ABC transporter ATP-binding protein [Lacticaseibacillus suilingensis]MCI1893468.1 ABC transporter ATP-binding protein [Lactobacillus sp.]MCI1917070.1 ABC transporter ATP-binding protein [Lactobacillus sp.]MCI1941025.1 ABC transporter ATP-binding protein [Lactobacillus sp.]MCI1971502.1 ABC transporter ATP-binding protein [Lactobacillus sp.]MCI2015999.1 ABC transporter ATP-binding protein [Lactobacillus sp.]